MDTYVNYTPSDEKPFQFRCDNLSKDDLQKCQAENEMLAHAYECFHSPVKSGCDPASRFVVTFLINGVLCLFYIMAVYLFYIDTSFPLYIEGYHIFAIVCIIYYALNIPFFLFLRGETRFVYLNLLAAVFKQGGRTVFGIFTGVVIVLTMPFSVVFILVFLSAVDFLNMILAIGVITKEQSRPLYEAASFFSTRV